MVDYGDFGPNPVHIFWMHSNFKQIQSSPYLQVPLLPNTSLLIDGWCLETRYFARSKGFNHVQVSKDESHMDKNVVILRDQEVQTLEGFDGDNSLCNSLTGLSYEYNHAIEKRVHTSSKTVMKENHFSNAKM